MTRRANEPEQNITLTGATNKQDFPAKVTDDAAAQDNRKRVQAAKEADFKRQTLPSEREAMEAKTVTKTLSGGTKVAGPESVVKSLR